MHAECKAVKKQFNVKPYAVSQCSREIGTRIALRGQPSRANIVSRSSVELFEVPLALPWIEQRGRRFEALQSSARGSHGKGHFVRYD